MDGGFVLLGGSGVSSGEITTACSAFASKNEDAEVSSAAHVVVDDGLGLKLSIGDSAGDGQHPLLPDLNSSPYVSDPPSLVGWPPLTRGHRLVIQANLPDEQSSSTPERTRAFKNSQQSVKVKMDGILVGRKVDLTAHNSYEALAQTLDAMFWHYPSGTEAAKLLDATSEFVLTYEDKDGDTMLAGSVPWQMFLDSVKRLRIRRNSEFNELGRKRTIALPTCQEKKTRGSSDGI